MTTPLLVACLITFATVIAMVRASSGAAGASTPSANGRAQGPDARVSAPVNFRGGDAHDDSQVQAVERSESTGRVTRRGCPDDRRGLAFYSRRYNEWRARMGAGAALGSRLERASSCSRIRYLAKRWRTKARAARLAFERWYAYHYDWRSWLPAAWQRLGACETGYGKRPGNWRWDSGSYVSAFGIYRDGYRADAHRIGNLSWDETIQKLGRFPTPREQYQAALSHYRTHGGFSGWGCA